MDREKLIQVSFQIPPSALDSLSRLAEQMRMLAEAAHEQTFSSGTAKMERGVSESFDPVRFHSIQESADSQSQAVRATVAEIEAAKAAFAPVSRAGNAEAVSAEVRKEIQNAESAGSTPHDYPEDAAAGTSGVLWRALPEERDIPLPPAEPTPERGLLDGIPAVHAEAETAVPRASEVGRDIGRQVPDAERTETGAEERALAPDAVQGELTGGVELPVGAGVVVQTQPAMPQSRWSGVTEELVIPGPAPLTAEAVSLAFERDGRRYDNGFPLY